MKYAKHGDKLNPIKCKHERNSTDLGGRVEIWLVKLCAPITTLLCDLDDVIMI